MTVNTKASYARLYGVLEIQAKFLFVPKVFELARGYHGIRPDMIRSFIPIAPFVLRVTMPPSKSLEC